MGDVGPVDRMGQRSAAGTSAGDMNKCMERVGSSQSLNERRLDSMRDKGKPPASTIREAEKEPSLKKRGRRWRGGE